MLFDRPAKSLYRHGFNLYQPMHVFATEYRWIMRIGIMLVLALLGGLILTHDGVLRALGITR